MDQIQTGILALMKSAITGEGLELPEGFPLEEALPIIKKHNVVPLWVYKRSFPKMDEGYICVELEKLHLQKFYENICRLIECWFENGPVDEKTEFIGAFIFNCGSWGTMDNYMIATEMRGLKNIGAKRYSKLGGLWNAVFPSREVMRQQYPMLKEKAYLLPVAWGVRLMNVLLGKQGNINRRRRALKLASSEAGENYLRALKYVGLEYRPEETDD